jgi:serine phosphatase RsbU (regulator of sigma subunit)
VFEAMNVSGDEFGAERLIEVVERTRHLDAKGVVSEIVAATDAFRAGMTPNDDMTAVAVKITI